MSGESDTESADETRLQEWKCNICNFKPNHAEVILLMQQVINSGPYLLTLLNGDLLVRCRFNDCQRYFHITCIHTTFPDEALNFNHLQDFRENGIHCPLCEPGFSTDH